MLWLSLGTSEGNLRGIVDPGSPIGFLHSVRATFPFIASFLAFPLILVGFRRLRLRQSFFFNPLGLAAVYGLVGVGASLLSPKGSVALYWAAAYLSVPLVLWAIAHGGDALEQIRRLINLNWLIILLGVTLLFTIGLLKLNLGAVILNPPTWLECDHSGAWERLTFQNLRSTGVGRYAALAAIVALGGLWQGKWRVFWSIILLSSLLLLVSTGARTAYAGFVVAVLLIVLLYGGKRAAVVLGVAILVLAPVLWSTGIAQAFQEKCLHVSWFGQTNAPVLPEAAPRAPSEEALLVVPAGVWELKPASTYESSAPNAQAPIPLAPGQWTIMPMSPQESAGSPVLFEVPPGEWALHESMPPPLQGLSQQSAPSEEARVFLEVPQDGITLERVSSLEPQKTVQAANPRGFATLTGRTLVWAKGWRLVKQSPILGYGFHADRLLLETHIHNSFMHALIQTGILGVIPFVAALLLAWVLLAKAVRNLKLLPTVHKHLAIQAAGMLAFFSVRAITESTGAFFGVDWLLLAPLLFYLHLLNRHLSQRSQMA